MSKLSITNLRKSSESDFEKNEDKIGSEKINVIKEQMYFIWRKCQFTVMVTIKRRQSNFRSDFITPHKDKDFWYNQGRGHWKITFLWADTFAWTSKEGTDKDAAAVGSQRALSCDQEHAFSPLASANTIAGLWDFGPFCPIHREKLQATERPDLETRHTQRPF